MFPVAVDTSDIKNAAVAFRGTSNRLTFMNTKYNMAGVHTATPKMDQYIFMSADFNAQFDVNVLAAAFNMDKADFMGRLKLIDDFTTFDNDRFSEIVAGSDQIDLVTDAELAVMEGVIAVLVDGEFFQFYDNNNKFTEKYVASGMYWNYFYNVWKTISVSPFSNAVVFLSEVGTAPATLTVTIMSKDVDAAGNVVFTLDAGQDNVRFIQTEDFVTAGVGVHPYGAVVIPAAAITASFAEPLVAEYMGVTYTAGTDLDGDADVGDTFTLSPPSP